MRPASTLPAAVLLAALAAAPAVAQETARPDNTLRQDWLLPYDATIRIRTVAPSIVTGQVLTEKGGRVTKATPETEEPITLSKPEAFIRGRLLAIEDDYLLVRVDGGATARVRRADLVTVEYRTKGSDAMGVVGGLAGMAGGFVAALLTCVAVEDLCDSTAPLWLGMAAGGVLGAAGGSQGNWVPVPVLSRGRVAVALKPASRGGSVGLRLSF